MLFVIFSNECHWVFFTAIEGKMKENKRCVIFHEKCYGIHGKIYTIIPQSEEKRRKIKVASFSTKKLKENAMEFMERSIQL